MECSFAFLPQVSFFSVLLGHRKGQIILKMQQRFGPPMMYYDANAMRREDDDDDEAKERLESAAEQAPYDLPPLPAPCPPETMPGNIATKEVYVIIKEFRWAFEESAKEAKAREVLLRQPELSQAIFRVLHESNLLRDTKSGTLVAPPPCPPPPLPPGISSWIYNARDNSEGFVSAAASLTPSNTIKTEVKAEMAHRFV